MPFTPRFRRGSNRNEIRCEPSVSGGGASPLDGYGGAMSADVRPAQQLAALFRTTRAERGYTVAYVVEQSGVSESAYKRYERGTVDSPYAAQVVAICRVLGIRPLDAAVALGYGTREDFDLPPEGPPDPQLIANIRRDLADETFSAAQRAALEHLIAGAYQSWQMAIASIDEHRSRRRS
jgi:transcriptional regulator with XRE-family HTH domain